MKILEVRKEENLYFQGPFWIVSDRFINILRGEFQILSEKYLSDYNGDYIENETSKRSKTHKQIWKNKYSAKFKDEYDWTYFPRGRVSIYQGVAFIHIHSRCNIPSIIDAIIKEYQLNNLEIEIEYNDELQGSHYDFGLR